jgi:hypothetical protein
MSEQREKRFRTEWSFDFGKVRDRVAEMTDSIVTDEEVKTSQFVETINGAEISRVRLNLALGETAITTLAPESPNLFEADLRHLGEIEYTVTGEAQRSIHVQQKPTPRTFLRGIRAGRLDLNWKIRVNPQTPLELDLNGGVGEVKLDLTGARLNRLTIKGGVGENRITLPAGGSYVVNLDGGVGQTTLTLPDHTAIRMNIDGGVGAVRLNVPGTAAVRITADGNLGNVKVPDHFQKIKTTSDFVTKGGVWETPGFAVAQQQIVIDLDGGVGNLVIRSEGPVVV